MTPPTPQSETPETDAFGSQTVENCFANEEGEQLLREWADFARSLERRLREAEANHQTLQCWFQEAVAALDNAGVAKGAFGHSLRYRIGLLVERAEAAERRVEREGIIKFALTVLEESRDNLCDLDGGWLQDKAEQCGLLVRIEVTEPCGENCQCAEYDDFPQQCLCYAESIKALLSAAPKDDNEAA